MQLMLITEKQHRLETRMPIGFASITVYTYRKRHVMHRHLLNKQAIRMTRRLHRELSYSYLNRTLTVPHSPCTASPSRCIAQAGCCIAQGAAAPPAGPASDELAAKGVPPRKPSWPDSKTTRGGPEIQNRPPIFYRASNQRIGFSKLAITLGASCP